MNQDESYHLSEPLFVGKIPIREDILIEITVCSCGSGLPATVDNNTRCKECIKRDVK
jgi:hypothetical protein